MQLTKYFLSAAIFLISSINLVLAGSGGYIELANLTPYDWKLTHTHSYHMRWNFPSTIPSGTTREQYFEFRHHHGKKGDYDAATTYELVGSPEPASFTVQARQNNGKRIEIQYGDQLSSLGNPVGSLLDLGFTHDGTVLFVLAGNETASYVGSNPPVAWMQATFPTIGHKSLREIAMPASHDAGMSQITRQYGGVAHNTVTQTHHVYEQLVNGARWLDVRPAYRKGIWYTNHMSGRLGTFGRTIHNIIQDVNRFTKEYPGELIILDLTHEMNRLRMRPRLTAEKWQFLYDTMFNGLNDIWVVNQDILPIDLSAVPISTFIQPGSKSAVLVRIPDHAPGDIQRPPGPGRIQKRDLAADDDAFIADPYSHTAIDEPLDINAPSIIPEDSFPEESDDDGGPDSTDDASLADLPPPKPRTVLKPAFIHARRLATVGEYSDTDSPSYLEQDQLAKLARLRPEPKSRMMQSTWTITQRVKHLFDIGNKDVSIIRMAVSAHRKLFSTIWKGLSSTTYPNLIEVDNIRDNQVTALCVAINRYFGMGLDLAGVKVKGKRMVRIRGREVKGESKSDGKGEPKKESKMSKWAGKALDMAVKGIKSTVALSVPGSPLGTRDVVTSEGRELQEGKKDKKVEEGRKAEADKKPEEDKTPGEDTKVEEVKKAEECKEGEACKKAEVKKKTKWQKFKEEAKEGFKKGFDAYFSELPKVY